MQPVPAGYPIAELSGPIVIGFLLNWGLFGALSAQLYLYYLAFPDDRRLLKYLVYGIYIIEFVQTMIVTCDKFAALGYGFGDIEALTGMYHSWLTVPIMSAAAASVGQVFYAYRIFVVSKSRIIPIFIICVSLTSSVAAVITGVYAFQAGSVIKLNSWKTTITIGIWCRASALCDILIAIYMTYYLMRNTYDFRHTRMLVTRIIRLTIETGSMTAVVALLTVILFLVFPHKPLYTTPALLMPKLYTNTIYMVLNSRIRIIGGRDIYISSTDMSFTTTTIRDVISQSGDGMQVRVPVVAMPNEVFNDDYEMGQITDKLQEGRKSFLRD
ncbi:hypothetical protein IW261DRAFT_1605024 [Armillaria novae-zelandiae]|uniref:DUF6534 domain-containing protein n=1 Tax=Armillaria novae-zelandiae TaxID=153914 RepID=A0AA39PIC1_9AGAR|nr:hypothetical protein IW261DRAFT_1605024 [Armillaria novae-zelandiae]